MTSWSVSIEKDLNMQLIDPIEAMPHKPNVRTKGYIKAPGGLEV